MTAIARCVRPGGELLVLCFGRPPGAERKGIPWPLSHTDLTFFETQNLKEMSFEAIERGRLLLRALYQKPEQP